jgi:hypothetical protein
MKREPMGNEREQDTWLGNTLRRSPATAADGCLDAETLAAYADGGLSTKAATVVELHASNCSRCLAVLATMERTAPAASVTEAWTLARVFRWAAPLAAAATAVAIWVAVPDRPNTQVESTISQDLKSAEQVPVPVPGAVPELRTETQNPAPSTGNLEKPQFRDEVRRERAEPQTLGSAAAPVAPPGPIAPIAPIVPSTGVFAPEAPPPAAEALARADAPQAAAPAPAPAQQKFAADTVAENATAATAQRSALSSATVLTSESPAPGNPLIRWRILANTLLERSRDGGKSWTRANGPAQNLAAVRAVDADRAVVRTSDKAEFYTANGGQSWTRVQENSTAPF